MLELKILPQLKLVESSFPSIYTVVLGLGIGTQMLDHVMDIVDKDGKFNSVVLHVQINNEAALRFYKRFGFEVVKTTEAFYKRIEPADAYVLEKKIDNTISNCTLAIHSDSDSDSDGAKVQCDIS